MVEDFRSLPARERIIVALDCEKNEALHLADALKGKVSWVKIGMTLYYACGPDIVSAFTKRGFKVFLDLKLHDIPHQVQKAAASAVCAGADMLTFHALGGTSMLSAGQRGVDDACAKLNRSLTITVGVTVLTSMDETALAEVGIERTPLAQVERLAYIVKQAGMSGVVASPEEASMLRKLLGQKAYIVTPGIRPVGSDVGDQRRVATPKEAFDAGASHIVVGRPITQAPDPVSAFEALAQGID